MKKTQLIITSVLSVLILLSPVIMLFSAVFLTPPVFSETFVGELDEKLDRLDSAEGEKLVVIGGSSVAFGIDSALMEKYLERPVVNFGLYAALGTKLMLDLSRHAIGEGDTVVLAPELDRQTLSMYFSAESTLEAMDDDYGMIKYVRGDDKLSLLGGLFAHAGKKLKYLREGIPSPSGVYNSKSFNEYTDVKYSATDSEGNVLWSRNENVMQLYYDPATRIELVEDVLSEDFVSYLNEYIAFCEGKGATVYFSYCPMNRLAIKEGLTDTDVTAFAKYLEKKINCEFISYIDSYIIEEGYFFDTNYHLNETGVLLRTKTLIEDIMIAEGSFRAVDIDVPKAPPLPTLDVKFFGEDENDKYFTYETLPNGALMISGLTELGKCEEHLTVPLGANYTKVSAIGANAFSGGIAKSVTVTADTNLRNLLDGSFADTTVTDLYIYYDFADENGIADEAQKLAPASDFFGITIHVPKYSQYLTHYDWRDTSGGYKMIDDIESDQSLKGKTK